MQAPLAPRLYGAGIEPVNAQVCEPSSAVMRFPSTQAAAGASRRLGPIVSASAAAITHATPATYSAGR
jgi:hypothetical protein